MDNQTELQRVIYNALVTQIQFGVYRYQDHLPTLDEASRQFVVSVDTVRCAYHRLKQNGYITLSKYTGAVVNVRYNEKDIACQIQDFFAQRRDSMIDTGKSMVALFGQALWMGLQLQSSQSLDQLEALAAQKELLPPYVAIQQFQQVYEALGNGLLERLIWQTAMFLHVPFLSFQRNLDYFQSSRQTMPDVISLCRKHAWGKLRQAVEDLQNQFASAVQQYYASHYKPPVSGQEASFCWSLFKKPSQICYSLGMELLTSIIRGVYPEGSYLPSLNKLAVEKSVSVSTIRRTIALLNSIGVTETMNGIGTQVLSPDQSAQKCDFSQPSVQNRLLDFIQSMHILALSCRACTKLTIEAMSVSQLDEWKHRLRRLTNAPRMDLIISTCLGYLCRYAPYRTIREVYSKLSNQLFWGYPIRSLHGNQQGTNAFYRPYIIRLAENLEQGDVAAFAENFEELFLTDLSFSANQLSKLGITGVDLLAIPTVQTKKTQFR